MIWEKGLKGLNRTEGHKGLNGTRGLEGVNGRREHKGLKKTRGLKGLTHYSLHECSIFSYCTPLFKFYRFSTWSFDNR